MELKRNRKEKNKKGGITSKGQVDRKGGGDRKGDEKEEKGKKKRDTIYKRGKRKKAEIKEGEKRKKRKTKMSGRWEENEGRSFPDFVPLSLTAFSFFFSPCPCHLFFGFPHLVPYPCLFVAFPPRFFVFPRLRFIVS